MGPNCNSISSINSKSNSISSTNSKSNSISSTDSKSNSCYSWAIIWNESSMRQQTVPTMHSQVYWPELGIPLHQCAQYNSVHLEWYLGCRPPLIAYWAAGAPTHKNVSQVRYRRGFLTFLPFYRFYFTTNILFNDFPPFEGLSQLMYFSWICTQWSITLL